MLVLDSNHANEHVLQELQLYSPLVTAGSYVVVFDTVIEDMPEGFFPDRTWDKGNNPKTAVCGTHNFSADKLTRVMLFTYDDITAMAGGDMSLVTAQAEDAQGTIYLLTIEYVGKLPNSGGLTQIVVKLADSIRLLDKIWITVTVRGVPGNRVLLRIDASDCSPT